MSNEAIESYQCPHCGCVKALALTIDALRAKLEVAMAALERCADTENDGCIGPWNDVAINALAQLKEPQ